MNDWPELLALAERQYGLVTRSQIRGLGGSQSAVLRVCRSAHWEQLTGQVLRRRGSPPSIGQRVMAAVLDAGGDAVLSHLPAGGWWGVPGCDLERLVLCTTKMSSTPTGLAEVHRVRELPDRWVTMLHGIPVVRPELLAMQFFATCRRQRAEILVDRLWSRRLLSGPSIADFLDSMGARGRNGIGGLRAYLDERGPSYVPPASGLEGRVMRLLEDVGIPMRRQVDSGGERWSGRVDFRHVRLPFVVEVQSELHHEALVDRRADADRIWRLVEDGFTVVEVTDDDVWLRPGAMLHLVEQALLDLRSTGSAKHFNRRTE